MKVTVLYRRYYREGSEECDSIDDAIRFIDWDSHYAYAAVLENGVRIEVDPDPFVGGPSMLRRKLEELLVPNFSIN